MIDIRRTSDVNSDNHYAEVTQQGFLEPDRTPCEDHSVSEDPLLTKLYDDIREIFVVEKAALSVRCQFSLNVRSEGSKSPLQTAGIGVCTAGHDCLGVEREFRSTMERVGVV